METKTMIELNLQLFGGNGSSGPSLGSGGGGLNPNDIKSETDVWSYRHRKGNEAFVDEINTGVGRIQSDFPDLMDTVNTVNTAELKGAAKQGVLGFYGGGTVALNQNYTDINKMNSVYDASVKSGFHPSRGSRTGTEAVALHETGHALTDHIGKKMGARNMDDAAKKIVDKAYKDSKGKGGTKAWAKKISGYATESNAECIAEAVADWYCNGRKSAKESQAIIKVLKSYK